MNHPTVRAYWNHLQTVYWGITGGATLVILASLFVHGWKGAWRPEWAVYRNYLLLSLGFVSFILLMIGRWQLIRFLTRARLAGTELGSRLAGYRSGLLSYLAFAESIVMLATILFLFVGDFSFLVFAAVILGIMLSQRPRKKAVPVLLAFSTDEQNKWNQLFV